MQPLSRDQILAHKTGKVQEVPLAGGALVHVRVMSGAELDSYEAGNFTLDANGKAKLSLVNARGRLAARCLCTPAGERLFNDADAQALGQLDAVFLDQVTDAAKNLNRLGRDSEEEEGRLFPPGQSSDSGTGPPPSSA